MENVEMQEGKEGVLFTLKQEPESQEQLEKKRIEIEQRLKAKNVQRDQQKKTRVNEHDKERDPDEDFNIIDRRYNQQTEEIKSELPKWKDIDSSDKVKLEQFFEGLFAKYKELRDYIAQFAYSIPTYNLQNYQQQLDTINENINKEKDAALPKKKFTFNRKQPKAKTEERKHEDPKHNIVKNILGNDLVIKDVYHQTIRKTEEEYEGKENLILENIENCEIYLPFKIKSIYAKNITDCKVYVGCVSGASFINQAKNCHFHMCSHQIRIHNSEKTHFYLIAKSNPIIEHCKEMEFGLYDCTYDKLEQHQKETQLHDIKNFYSEVLDFNWLKQDKSPNWDVIENQSQELIKID